LITLAAEKAHHAIQQSFLEAQALIVHLDDYVPLKVQLNDGIAKLSCEKQRLANELDEARTLAEQKIVSIAETNADHRRKLLIAANDLKFLRDDYVKQRKTLEAVTSSLQVAGETLRTLLEESMRCQSSVDLRQKAIDMQTRMLEDHREARRREIKAEVDAMENDFVERRRLMEIEVDEQRRLIGEELEKHRVECQEEELRINERRNLVHGLDNAIEDKRRLIDAEVSNVAKDLERKREELLMLLRITKVLHNQAH
jgi:hypothetical protein